MVGPTVSTSKLGSGPANFILSIDPERLISVGRLVTALFAILAIYLDPTRPAYFIVETRMLLAFYAIFASMLLVFPIKRPIDHHAHLLTHGIDLLVLCSLALITDELSSPFCSLLPFVLLVTTARWGLQGAIVGAIAVEAVMLIVGWPDLDDGESELNILIMRSAYFLAAAIMLGYFGASRDLSRQRLERLANWPEGFAGDTSRWLGSLLRHAANVLGNPQLIVIWQDQEGSTGNVAVWFRGDLVVREVVDQVVWQAFEPSIPGSVGRATANLRKVYKILSTISAPPDISSAILSKQIYSAAFSRIRFRGEIFILNPSCYQEEGETLTRIIASRIASELEQRALTTSVAQSARDEERTRLARDLHDSILQDLTAASLKLKAAGRSLPSEAQTELDAVGGVLLDQQRRIRHYVEHVQLEPASSLGPLGDALRRSASSLRHQWNCDIDVHVKPRDLMVSISMATEISKLLSEATANAVRHGSATMLEVTAVLERSNLQVHIADNGCGICHVSPENCQLPESLAARVSDMRGILTIARTAPGLALAISLPIFS